MRDFDLAAACTAIETARHHLADLCEVDRLTAALDGMLAHYSRALDEIYRMRVAAAFDAQVADGLLHGFAGLPKNVRYQLDAMRERLRAAARGESETAYAVDGELRARVLDNADAPATLTRGQWEASCIPAAPVSAGPVTEEPVRTLTVVERTAAALLPIDLPVDHARVLAALPADAGERMAGFEIHADDTRSQSCMCGLVFGPYPNALSLAEAFDAHKCVPATDADRVDVALAGKAAEAAGERGAL